MLRKRPQVLVCILTVCAAILSSPSLAQAEEAGFEEVQVLVAEEMPQTQIEAVDGSPKRQDAEPQGSVLDPISDGEGEPAAVAEGPQGEDFVSTPVDSPELTDQPCDDAGDLDGDADEDLEQASEPVDEGDAAEAPDNADSTSDGTVLEAQEDDLSAKQAELDAYAAKHANDIADGVYQILSKLDKNYSLDVQGGKTADGTGIIIYTAGVKSNQRWEIVHLSTGYATIKSVGTGKYLSLKGEDQAYASGAAAQVVQWAYQSDAPWQQWVIAKDLDGYFTLTSALLKLGDTRVLDVRGGKATKSAQVILYADREKANQRWAITVTKDILDGEAKEHKSDLKDGTYIIGNGLDSDYTLNVQRSSMDNGGSIILWQAVPTVNEGFTVAHTKDGYATITGALSGKVLDVRGAKAADGTAVIQWTQSKNNARNQLWIISRAEDGSYRITSALVGRTRFVLSIAGSDAKNSVLANIQVDKGSAEQSQCWTFEEAPEQYRYAHAIANGTYVIRTALDTTKVLDVSGASVKAGAAVKLWKCSWANNQIWTVTHDNQGYVSIKNENSGKYLAISAGCAIQSSEDYKWVVESVSGGKLRLRDASTGKYLDVSRSSTSNGAKVISYPSGTGTNQKWTIAKAVVALNGVDISGWNTGIDYSKLGNFVIIKATEWNPDTRTYTSYNNYKSQADKALAAGKLIGFYHFATNTKTSKQTVKDWAREQAQGFINAVSVKDSKGNYKYLGKAMLFLDWEDTTYSTIEGNVDWAKEWLDYVYQKTKVKPMIYMNKNCSVSYDWSSVSKAGYDLWGAQYLPDYYDENPSTMITSFVGSPRLESGWGAWGSPTIYQYTSTCKLHGNSVYDVNKFYGTAANWKMRAMVK